MKRLLTIFSPPHFVVSRVSLVLLHLEQTGLARILTWDVRMPLFLRAINTVASQNWGMLLTSVHNDGNISTFGTFFKTYRTQLDIKPSRQSTGRRVPGCWHLKLEESNMFLICQSSCKERYCSATTGYICWCTALDRNFGRRKMNYKKQMQCNDLLSVLFVFLKNIYITQLIGVQETRLDLSK